MPETRGRKRRIRDRDRRERSSLREPSVEPASAPIANRQQAAAGGAAVPSNMARATGAIIAAVTVVLGVMSLVDGMSGDHSTADAVTRVAVGVFLLLLGIAVGVLSLFPARVRRMIRGA